MAVKIGALSLGIIFLFFGIAGFFPGLVTLPLDRLRFFNVTVLWRWGFLFGWMPTNPVHNIVYTILGIGGIGAAPVFRWARAYCQGMFAVTVLFVMLGVAPLGISRLWGLIPLFDWNILFHTVAALIAFYLGWVYPLDLGGPEPESEMRPSYDIRG
jgi:hypothetical protein